MPHGELIDHSKDVARAICLVRRQLGCGSDGALWLMNERAKFSRITLDHVAEMVLDGRISWAD